MYTTENPALKGIITNNMLLVQRSMDLGCEGN
jgi:hypothetical protein